MSYLCDYIWWNVYFLILFSNILYSCVQIEVRSKSETQQMFKECGTTVSRNDHQNWGELTVCTVTIKPYYFGVWFIE